MPVYAFDGVVPVVDPTAFVHETASLIGDVIVGPGCYVGPFASARGDFGRIVIGDGSNVQDGCVLHAFPGVDAVLEPNSHVGHGATLHGCRIGSYALIGIGAVVLDGAVVGENALVGAGAVVTAGQVIPARSMALGCPAKVTGGLDDDAVEWKRNGVRLYQELARRSRLTLHRADPLAQVEPDRTRVQWSADAAHPLHIARSGHR
ncbi:gamma carbonic anhydrase family protein [Microbacterium sp. zg.Y1090]|uniref:gamma carbonic anhydrase family protein n=1 Tax=Microbacterium TaxID=33882 RepID=UPI00214CF5E1|nr:MULTISPECIES: gamma carbonic anhydrase family protein [unclassified Microbacterium]MCR2813327.1 gamma carbonic anhydrase family protein [Microbacterium sp. zg.Y1084]MCR2819839.1 gamma carbonic anhydrase family protein [Microbacterium sp. zg.Y1090]MDL5487950.1 gamma carbonic anhydrase family protein [Microbacterium sp. zg-Y1211]WIM28604.1 gamma carbonic anhydrase family protein [Microbacterium sp. zg-Y1090]